MRVNPLLVALMPGLVEFAEQSAEILRFVPSTQARISYFAALALKSAAYSPYPCASSWSAGMKRIDAEFMQ